MSNLLDGFQKNTADFLDALALFPDRSRTIAPAGEWSAAYIVHHVADGELHFAARYLHTLGSDNPTMVYFDEDRYPEALSYEKRTVAKSLASIAGIRAMIFEVLSNVDESAWSRQTTSEDGKSFTLAELVAKASGHLVSHTEQLRALHAQI
ncbi:metal-dependent hydrolase [Candidatus Nanopelagicaceae bacterium]